MSGSTQNIAADMGTGVIHVAAGAILDTQGRVLLTKRAEHAHQGGLWEFPGGKLEPDETVQHALARELKEELGIGVTSSHPLIRITHQYNDRTVCLDVHVISGFTGAARGLEDQPLRWVEIDDIDCAELPAADVPIVNALKLPERYLITGKFDSVTDFQHRLQRAIAADISLIQLRIKQDWYAGHRKEFAEILQFTRRACQAVGAILMLNVPEEAAIAHDNIHADSRQLQHLTARPDCDWFSASCHTAEDLVRACHLGADFAVLSPVQYTRSHPDAQPLGWEAFSRMIENVNIPVYALGGVGAAHIDQSRLCGAQGVAGIGAFWE